MCIQSESSAFTEAPSIQTSEMDFLFQKSLKNKETAGF